MITETDLAQGERIAVLETKVDDLHKSINELKALLEPMVAVYKLGRVVIWIGGTVLSYVHWDQIVAFVQQLTDAPKHH